MAYTGTNFSAPKLDGQALRRYTSKNIMENIFQSILHLPEKGVTERYSEDVNASEIRIIRQVAPDIKARRAGATVNGGYFNTNAVLLPQSVEYGLKILYMIDDQVDFPTVMDEMVELPVAEATTKAVGGIVGRNINASTTAHQLSKVINASIDGTLGTDYNTVTLTAADKIKEAIIEANAKLDDGDETNGVDIFPIDGRQLIIRASTRAKLFTTGNIFVGGSNYAQEMLERGVISPGTYKQDNLQYVGEIDQVPVSVMAKVGWNLAEEYMQQEAGFLDDILGLIVAGIGTGRALAFNNSVKIIDSPAGQGKRAQYKYRWGIETFFAKSVVPIIDYGKTLPLAKDTDNKTIPVVIEAPGSVASV